MSEQQEAQVQEHHDEEVPTVGDHPRVLFVDDEENILNTIKRIFRRENVEVFTSIDPNEALELVKSQSFAAIVSDYRMPQMSGTDLLMKVREVSPDTTRLILSGYADIEASLDAINRCGVFRFLTKPWEDELLKETVREAVMQFQLLEENRHLQRMTIKQNEQLTELNLNLEKKVDQRTSRITKLNRGLERTFLGCVQVMTKLVESHSPMVGGHCRRVATLCRELGKRLGFEDRELLKLVVAGTLHDIGKVAIPLELIARATSLLKPYERDVVWSHATIGEGMIRMVPNFEREALIVRHHHEHYGSKGYPGELSGEDIPLESRIIAVASAFDHALYSISSLNSSSRKDALHQVQGRTPTIYDPKVVSVLEDYVKWVNKHGDPHEHEIKLEIGLNQLRPGMVLANDLKTARAVLLLPKDTVMQPKHVQLLREHETSDPVMGTIQIYWKPDPRIFERVKREEEEQAQREAEAANLEKNMRAFQDLLYSKFGKLTPMQLSRFEDVSNEDLARWSARVWNAVSIEDVTAEDG